MGAFGNYYKDQISQSIINFYEDRTDENSNAEMSDIIKDIMEAVTYGLESIFTSDKNRPTKVESNGD